MRKILLFWWECGKRAASGASQFANDWQWLVGLPLLGAAAYVVNRYYGEGALTFSQDTTLGAFEAAAIAFCFTWIAKFVFALFAAPAEMYQEKVDENAKIIVEIRYILDSECAIKRLSDFYIEGKKMYSEYNTFDEWNAKMQAWTDEVEQFIIDNFSVSELHVFRTPGSGFEITTNWNWEEIEHNKSWVAKATITGRLHAIDQMVKYADNVFMPHKEKLEALVRCNNN
jgi:hypothetical protein